MTREVRDSAVKSARQRLVQISVTSPARALACMLAATAAFAPACGTLLTKEQTDVIVDFSRANEAYSKLPGSVLRSYDEVHLATRVIGASAAGKENAARESEQIRGAVDFWQEIEAEAVRLDAALEVLDRYRAVLVRLSSPDLADLDGAATDLGNALDGSIKAYNQLPNGKANPLPSIGSYVAAGVRAVGGTFARNRQLAYLREYVEQATPLIERLTSDVKDLVEPFIGPNGSFAADAANVNGALKDCLAGCAVPLGPADLELFAETLRREAVATALAEKVRDTSSKLAASHKALRLALAPKPSVHEAREEIEALVGELQAAAKLMTRIGAK